MSTTEARLREFAALVAAWNPRINLVGAADLPALWERHIEDCLQLVPLLPAGLDRAIDLGSGAGFPGLVLAIATDIPFDLIEADRRKAAFLAEAAHRLGAPVRVHACRIEAAPWPPPASSPRARWRRCRACCRSQPPCSHRAASACSRKAAPPRKN